ncbi:glycosyltransferase [Nitrosomonas ureae]|uniref:Glycosyltransferase involved in cell wall bisynthesis n=1 Tax=Nitrosomonas ureae TaxID=44577 RepID=A0A286AFZ6_9PROT|nr:glycosyltransferase [Nitrosomonas ureae]SOD20824.1 Glycosyltransferase involved in cell wall bisynthesis [Nitrosomonas ureae]
MKMLYIVEDRFPPFRADVVELFAKQMPDRGHQIDWLMQRGPDALNLLSPTDWLGNIVYLTPRSKWQGLFGRILNNLLGMQGDLMILFLAFKNRYDVIQVRDKFFASLIAWLAARLTGARFTYWMSYPFAESKLYQAHNKLVPHHRLVWLKGQLIRNLLYKIILPAADHIFVQSDRKKEDVVQEGISPDKMTAVPMGIRADQVGKAEDARAPNMHSPLLLHLGIIMQLRQSEMLVRVLQQVRLRYPDARLLYVGDGQLPSDRQAVEKEASRVKLSKAVTITGFMPMETAWELVEQADICFSPFYPVPVLLSTSPTKLVEYMAMAKCIVANEHPEQCQVMEASGIGRCVPWGEQSFADEVCKLLDDPERARTLASRGPDWVRKYRTYDVIADHVESQYKKLLGLTI